MSKKKTKHANKERAKKEKIIYVDDGSSIVRSDELATDRDILFYENNAEAMENSVYLTPGTYAIYLPWDVHVPGQNAFDGSRPFRKIVMKVPLDACLK